MPAMINLQQYYLEERLVKACDDSSLVDLRWKHKLLGIEQSDEFATLTVETPDGIFKMEAAWVIAATAPTATRAAWSAPNSPGSSSRTAS